MDRRFILVHLCSLLQFCYRFGVFLFPKIDGSKSIARGAVVGLEPEHSLEVFCRLGRFSLLRVDHAEPVMSEEVRRLGCDRSFVGILRFFAIPADQEDLSQLVERRRIVGVDLQYSLEFCLCLSESVLQSIDETEAVARANVSRVHLDRFPVFPLGALEVTALHMAQTESVVVFTLSG